MKKTLIALMALAGVAAAGAVETETLWTVNFGTEYEGGYQVIDGTSTYVITDSWDMNFVSGGIASSCVKDEEGNVTSTARPHLRGDTGVDWTDDFQFTITFTTPETIVANQAWPVIAGLEENTLRFGPYLEENNYINIDGAHNGKTSHNVALTSGLHTATLTVIDGKASLYLDSTLAAECTLQDSLSGDIKNITLGGGGSSSYRMNQVVHSMSMAKIVPEPTTATLSLLALAGLAARRRRK